VVESGSESEGAAGAPGQPSPGGPAADAASKVQEAAAHLHAGRSGRREAETVARSYFEAIARRDVQAALSLWASGGRERVLGLREEVAPEGVRAVIEELLDAFPDLRFEVLATTSEEDRCGVQWRLTGTFAGPGSINGLQPTGDLVKLEGLDLLTVREGLIQGNDSYLDTMELARAVGLMPPLRSPLQRRMVGAYNLKTRLARVSISEAELIATGVWVVQGQPGRCNVYLIEDEGGVSMFDAGARTMVRSLASATAKLGGLRRIVLGHGHTDHRGAAPSFDVPVLCHPDEVQDAEGSGGFRYWPPDLEGLPSPQRQVHRILHRLAWDGGPVKISGTVREGDEVAGFQVIDLPGHAPGLIGLWRESDRLALCSDCFYTLDMWGRDCPPHLPEKVYNIDTEQARASMLKLAALQPAAAWAGHAKPATGDVRGQLEAGARES
jgi:hydroxyacylglutathione hydrolase